MGGRATCVWGVKGGEASVGLVRRVGAQRLTQLVVRLGAAALHAAVAGVHLLDERSACVSSPGRLPTCRAPAAPQAG